MGIFKDIWVYAATRMTPLDVEAIGRFDPYAFDAMDVKAILRLWSLRSAQAIINTGVRQRVFVPNEDGTYRLKTDPWEGHPLD